MKKIYLGLGLLFVFAAATAQQDPRCPQIRRNNGNAGSCDAKITLIYPSCPAINYQLIGILFNGQPLQGLSYYTGPCQNGMVEVCVQGGNLPSPGAGPLSYGFSATPGGSLLFTCNETGGGNLPVNISSFHANRRTRNQVMLSWQTDFELNAKEFVIQRKTGNLFEDIATISANNLLAGSSYTFQDVNASKYASQYRLKAVDIDGSFLMSDIRNVKGTMGAVDFFVYPNPSFGRANLSIADTEGEYEVSILDNTGRVIRTLNISGDYSTQLTNLPKGNLMIRVVNKVTGEKLTKSISVL